MAHFKVNERDIFFILKDQLSYGKLCALDRYRELDEATMDMLVTEIIKFSRLEIDPLQEIGEKWGGVLEEGQVRCAPEFKRAFKTCAENGWIAVARDHTYGGQGFPYMMRMIQTEMMSGAAQSFGVLGLTHGAGHLIENFATDDLKELFVPRMYSGQWAGTMALTEPNAGSNLAGLRTTAYREGDHFKIKGNKMFISYGDHDLTKNIIHLLLARIEGAPEGIKGISLFIVPKIRVNPDGSLGEPNDVQCTGIEKKLGMHAKPTCALSFGENDGCIGYLCGEENRGLAHMFQMMNAARIASGITGMTLASSAYLHALQYAKERIQGSDVARRKDGYVPIIDHPDVRRMLLWMKAMVDGMRSMCYTDALWEDYAHELSNEEERQHYQALLDFMTPIVKTYCAEMGTQVTMTAMQVHGGYGYCEEYHVAQYLRDGKAASLYEGTSGIQSMDLMGRKMQINGGAPYKAFMSEINKFIDRYFDHPVLGKEIGFLSNVVKRLSDVAAEMLEKYKSDPLQWASSTYPVLLCFGDVTVTWRLLDIAIAAQRNIDEGENDEFFVGKIKQATYFTDVTLPLTMARLETCLRKGREIIEIPDAAF